MKKLFTILAVISFAVPALSQINAEDSSVQIIGYWDNKEKHTYTVQYYKMSVQGNDTIVTDDISYKADILVTDSTATSYTVQWKFYNIVANCKNEMANKLAKLNEGLVINIVTDEMGSFQELMNWEEIKKHNEKAARLLVFDSGNNIEEKTRVYLKGKYSSKEAIERHSLNDIQQFYDFHGIQLKIGEPLDEQVSEEVPITKEPVKSRIQCELTEIDAENGSYIVKMNQSFDGAGVKVMLKDLMVELLDEEAGEFIKDVSIQDYRAAEMHESGWPLELYFERVMHVNDTENIETRSIVFEE
jgi:hypothetical protein